MLRSAEREVMLNDSIQLGLLLLQSLNRRGCLVFLFFFLGGVFLFLIRFGFVFFFLIFYCGQEDFEHVIYLHF